MRNDIQQIMNILNSMNEKLGRIQSSIIGSESSIDESTKEDCQLDHVINEADIMNRLLVKILGSLNKISIVELLSFTTISAYDREFSAVISFKSIDNAMGVVNIGDYFVDKDYKVYCCAESTVYED